MVTNYMIDGQQKERSRSAARRMRSMLALTVIYGISIWMAGGAESFPGGWFGLLAGYILMILVTETAS